jgi:hypothetical protein
VTWLKKKERIRYQNLGNKDYYYDPRTGRKIDNHHELMYELQPFTEDREYRSGARQPQELYYDVITVETITPAQGLLWTRIPKVT